MAALGSVDEGQVQLPRHAMSTPRLVCRGDVSRPSRGLVRPGLRKRGRKAGLLVTGRSNVRIEEIGDAFVVHSGRLPVPQACGGGTDGLGRRGKNGGIGRGQITSAITFRDSRDGRCGTSDRRSNGSVDETVTDGGRGNSSSAAQVGGWQIKGIHLA